MTDWRISDTYRKDTVHPPGHGYGRQTSTGAWVGERMLRPSTLIVHTTNNSQKNTKVWNEATFIRDSKDISCHDLIAKDGTIYVILPPNLQAWHAGVALAPYTNPHSIGIEVHCSLGETPTQAQKDALAWRVRGIIEAYDLAEKDIDTHRKVALPKGRKSDPEGWSDAEFYAWRGQLFSEPDWVKAWGSQYPYFASSGIATAWRETYRQGAGLGAAVSDEFMTSAGVVRAFVRGYISWTAAGGTKVHEW